MSEIYTKFDENSISIKPEVITPETVVKDFDTLQADLKQAQDSLVYVQQRHAEEIAPITATISLFQMRLDEAVKKGVVAREVIKEVIEAPLEEVII